MFKSTLFTSILTMLLVFGNAQTWTSVGIGANGPVHNLHEFEGGISAGGEFTQMNAFTRINHCKIREVSTNEFLFFTNYSEDLNTSSLGTNLSNTSINAAAWFNNRLHVGGFFLNSSYSGPVSLAYFDTLANEDSTELKLYANQLTDSSKVFALHKFGNQLFIGGNFQNLNGASATGYIETADYPSPTVKPAGDNISGVVRAFETHDDILYAGGWFSISDTDTVIQTGIAQWDGTSWSLVENGLNGMVFALQSTENGLVAGGAFDSSGLSEISSVALWDGTSWSAMGAGFADSTDTVFSLNTYGDSLYAGGRLTDTNEVYKNIARWTGTEWLGIGPVNGPVYTMANHAGRMYAGGNFTKTAKQVARFIAAHHNGIEPLGVEGNQTSGSHLNVWPNPTTGEITIQSETQLIEVKVLDISGKTIIVQQTNSESVRMELSLPDAGVYLLETTDATGQKEHLKIIYQP